MRINFRNLYHQQTKCLVALDSIIFGFDGLQLKLLLIKRGVENERDTWSLMGGWLREREHLDTAAKRIVKELTDLDNVYLEQIGTFGDPERDPIERTVSVAYFALINVPDYDTNVSHAYEADWFPIKELPELLFDHQQMVENAIQRLRYKAAFHPIGFELMPEKFTLPQLQTLYEAIFDSELDKRNFARKVLSTDLVIKLEEKQLGMSKKGAFLYQLNKKRYKEQFEAFHNFIPNPTGFI